MQDTSDSATRDSESERLSSCMPITPPLQPTAAYLAIARSPSVRASHAPKKLLILDLNGTLLYRSKRGTAIRQIYLRPYMPAFRAYLFHEAVKPWLDVMVWSSAQPHNVNDMVKRCFKGLSRELKGTWARNTLGLNEADYSRKVQTVKDLEKPWSTLPDSLPRHTAETTLLMDDSSQKAHLQPYNHVCVPEYTQNVRIRDLTAKTKTRLLHAEGRMQEAEQARLGFDRTFIAMMGVLDEVKVQTNVAGWIRAGGLWGGHRPPSAHHSSLQLLSEERGTALASSDESLYTMTDTPETERDLISDPGNETVLSVDGTELTWFGYEPCFQYWVERGMHVAEALRIKMDHGM